MWDISFCLEEPCNSECLKNKEIKISARPYASKREKDK